MQEGLDSARHNERFQGLRTRIAELQMRAIELRSSGEGELVASGKVIPVVRDGKKRVEATGRSNIGAS
jgi:hypothetical protein